MVTASRGGRLVRSTPMKGHAVKVYFHTPERPESSCWREIPALPVNGETVHLDHIPFTVVQRIWNLGFSTATPDAYEVTIYLEQR